MKCDEMRRLALVTRTAMLRSVEVDILIGRKEVEGVRDIAGCSSTREARVTQGLKMPPEVVVEETVEEEEVVTVHMLGGRDDTTC